MPVERYAISCMTDAEIDLLSQLSQIALQPKEKVVLKNAINDMLRYFATMNAFIEEDGQDRDHIGTKDLQHDIPRQQVTIAPEMRGSLIGQAPEHESEYIVVPNVL